MKEYYNSNPDFKDYVDRYARDNKLSPEEALSCELVRQTYLYYKEREENK